MQQRSLHTSALFVWLLAYPQLLAASLGDIQPSYVACVLNCNRTGCVAETCVLSCAHGSPRTLAAPLRLLRWDCAVRTSRR